MSHNNKLLVGLIVLTCWFLRTAFAAEITSSGQDRDERAQRPAPYTANR